MPLFVDRDDLFDVVQTKGKRAACPLTWKNFVSSADKGEDESSRPSTSKEAYARTTDVAVPGVSPVTPTAAE